MPIIEIDEKEKKRLQEAFLGAFLEECTFSAGCIAVQGILNGWPGEKKQRGRTLVGEWLVEDAAFIERYEQAKKIVDRIRHAELEDFLNKAGTGKDKAVTNSQVVAAHMGLEAYDPAVWSSKKKVPEKSKETPVKAIGYGDHPGRPPKKGVNDD